MTEEAQHNRDAGAEHVQSEDVAELRARLEEATKRADEYVALAQRVQADFRNYKRRVEQERERQAKYAHSKLILKLLPVLDDLDRAMDSVKAELAGLNWVQGIGLIRRKLYSVLESEGLTRIEALGQDFDPRFHEAVVHEEAGEDDGGKVLSVLQPGYMLRDRVIRPAMVKVGKATRSRDDHAQNSKERDHNLKATFSEEDFNA